MPRSVATSTEITSPQGSTADMGLFQRNTRLIIVSTKALTFRIKCAQPAVRLRTRPILKKSISPVRAAATPPTKPAAINQKEPLAQKLSSVNQKTASVNKALQEKQLGIVQE